MTSLGACPQLNVIFEVLTPVHHLTLYGELKGLKGAQLAQTIDELQGLLAAAVSTWSPHCCCVPV